MNKNKYKTFNINEKTPDKIYNQLNDEFKFTFDPCPLNENPNFNGLKIKWGTSCYINPPYGRQIPLWLEKAIYEIVEQNTKTAVFLLPASTDTKWFHEIILPHAKEIRFIKGRLKFSKHKYCAPFASMIVIFE